MKLLSAVENKNLDRLAMEKYAIPGIVLMEHAAREVVEAIVNSKDFEEDDFQKAIVICGKGNNGGDGFGVARWLSIYGYQVKVFLVGARPSQLTGDALLEYNMFTKGGGVVETIADETEELIFRIALKHSDFVVDAMLGIGFSGELRPELKRVCQLVNASGKYIVAVDMPTGVNADDGSIDEDAIRANQTVTMNVFKPGQWLFPGRECVGRVKCVGIGMSDKVLEDFPANAHLIDDEMLYSLFPERRENAHKGEAGRVAICAGSPGFTGAAALAAKGAIKTGSGLVSVLTPLASRDVIAGLVIEAMTQGLIERMPGVLGGGAVGQILEFAAKCDVLAIGPGLGTNEASQEVIRDVLSQTETPVVIDADAITALKDHLDILKNMHAPKVLTPHVGEMARLTGLSAEEIEANRMATAYKYAIDWNAVVVLKGAPTIVGTPSGNVYLNPTGAASMATGGCGDVLTGMLASLIGQGISVEQAAICAVYIHGLAGENATEGTRGLAASEITEEIPEVIHEYLL